MAKPSADDPSDAPLKELYENSQKPRVRIYVDKPPKDAYWPLSDLEYEEDKVTKARYKDVLAGNVEAELEILKREVFHLPPHARLPRQVRPPQSIALAEAFKRPSPVQRREREVVPEMQRRPAPPMRQEGVSWGGNSIELHKFEGNFTYLEKTPAWRASNSTSIKKGSFVSLTKAGASDDNSTPLEIAVIPFEFDERNGQIVHVGAPYHGFGPARKKLSERTKAKLSIPESDLGVEAIDWGRVDSMLANSQVVLSSQRSRGSPRFGCFYQ